MLRCLLMLMASHYAPSDAPLSWDPDNAFWRDTPPMEVVTDNFGKQEWEHGTQVRSRWTKNNLYFQFTCHYIQLYLHPNPTRTSETHGLWDWDVAEVFLGSDFRNIRLYREFEMSPQGEWLDLDIDLSRPADDSWNSGFTVAYFIDEKAKIWYGAMRIPYRSVDSRNAVAGNLLRCNIYRQQGPGKQRVEISWQPTMQRSFHVPERFGTLALVP